MIRGRFYRHKETGRIAMACDDVLEPKAVVSVWPAASLGERAYWTSVECDAVGPEDAEKLVVAAIRAQGF